MQICDMNAEGEIVGLSFIVNVSSLLLFIYVLFLFICTKVIPFKFASSSKEQQFVRRHTIAA